VRYSPSCPETVNLLLKQDGIGLNARETDTGYTPLATACLNNNTDIVRLLLSHPDTDPNAVDNDGASILALVDSNYVELESHSEDLNNLFNYKDSYYDFVIYSYERGLPDSPREIQSLLAAGAEIRSLLRDAGAIVIKENG
jgi:ankyrin repeat protein